MILRLAGSARNMARHCWAVPTRTDAPPQPALLAGDHQAHFVEVPFLAPTGQLAADLVGETLVELARPLPHGLVTDENAAGRQLLVHHAKAQRKPEGTGKRRG